MSSEFPPVDLAEWRARVEKDLKGRDFEKSLVLANEAGIPLQPVYDASNAAAAATDTPGQFPFLRGTTTTPGFLRIQEYDESDNEQLYRLIDDDMDARLDGIRIRLDRRLRLGSNPHEEENSSTTDGALLYEMGTLAEVLKPAFEVTGRSQPVIVSLDAGGNALPLAACALALRELESSSAAALSFHFNADPISALVRDGLLPRSLAKMQSEALSLALRLSMTGGADRAIAIDGEIWQEAGVSTARELGFMLASLASWLRVGAKSQVKTSVIARQIVLRIGMERDIFLGIAKLRALRQLWSALLAHYGVTDVAPLVWSTTARRTLAQIDPWVNILRASSQGLSAITGGADVVSVRPFDLLADAQDPDIEEWIEYGDDEESLFKTAHELRRDSCTRLGRRLARNTLLILDEEAGLAAVQDPAGGAHYLEELTEKLAAAGFKAFQAIEAEGGIAAQLAREDFANSLASEDSDRALNFSTRKSALTAVTEFPVIDDNFEPEFDHNREREHRVLREHLSQHQAARGYLGGLNPKLSLVDGMVDAAARGATIDELSRELADSSPPSMIEPPLCTRDSWSFEMLRASSASSGRPTIYLATLGNQADYLPRLSFAENLYSIAAFELLRPAAALPQDGQQAAQKILAEAEAAGAQAICLVGTDVTYDEHASAIIESLHDALGDEVEIHLAGRLQPERQEELESLGLTTTIHLGCNVLNVLSSIAQSDDWEEDWDDLGMSLDDLEDLQ